MKTAKKKLYFLFCFVTVSIGSFCQQANTIKGRVISEQNGVPVAGCSVFLNSTSRGTITDNSGEFELLNIPAGKYELIVSSIGYETYTYSFSGSQLPLELKISIRQKATSLSEVTVEPFVKNGWETWGQTFIEDLIGTTENAKGCTIQNKETVHFRFSKKNNKLTAIADEPLVIENKALGYIIKFQLEEFSVDFNSNFIVYIGYPLFTAIPTKSNLAYGEWKEKRKDAYLGSMMHFIRTLYAGELIETSQFNPEGFEVRRDIKLANQEKLRVKEIYANYKPEKDKPWQADTIKYYKKVLRQPDSLLYNQLLTADKLLTSTSSADHDKTLFFTDHLNIIFSKKRKIGIEVKKSTIYLITPAPVNIEENGHYDSPLEIFTLGFWSNSEKLANMLPLDYWPDDQ